MGLFALGIHQSRPVKADNGTVLAVLPAQGQVYLDGVNSIEVQIYVSNVTNLNAFDITITYNQNTISIIAWSHGGLLKNLFCTSPVNNPGFFRLSCTQMGGPGVNGEGSLINLTFSGVSGGVSAVTIAAAMLADKNNPSNEIPAQLQHGVITVSSHSSAIKGTVYLQGRVERAGVPASLGIGTLFGQGPYTALSTSILGQNLDFGLVANGDTYTLTTAQPRYLNVQKTLTVNSALTLPPLRLLAGDVTGDQAVTTADLNAIRAAFGSSGTELAADINGDGLVDLRDLALAGGNFGLTATEAYADWLE